jgi:hypothetical protein
MDTKRRVLEFIADAGPVTSGDVMVELGYETLAGAAAVLLRYHKHGHLRRRRGGLGEPYEYEISEKGHGWLEWWRYSGRD